MTITLAELARSLDAALWGEGSLRITGAAEPAEAGEARDGQARIALAMTPAYAADLAPGAAALIAEGMDPAALGLAGAVIVRRPRLAMAGLTRLLDSGPGMQPGIHPRPSSTPRPGWRRAFPSVPSPSSARMCGSARADGSGRMSASGGVR